MTVEAITKTKILAELAEILEQRKTADPNSSYVASLYTKGLDKILKKLGEEAVETIIAAKSQDKSQIIYETADLWFHSLILLHACDLSHEDILTELQRRFGLSGITEKANRS